MTREPLSRKHEILAEEYSSHNYEKLCGPLTAWTKKRNAAVAELYYTYGGVVTSETTGWSRPTVMKCVDNAAKQLAKQLPSTGKETP